MPPLPPVTAEARQTIDLPGFFALIDEYTPLFYTLAQRVPPVSGIFVFLYISIRPCISKSTNNRSVPKELPHNEKELLQLVAAGDEGAFRDLFDAYRNKIFFYIFRLTESRQTAEDVLQDVFLKIWLERADLQQINNFNAWVYRLAQNQAINGLKRMARETIILSELGKQVSGQAVPGADEQFTHLELKKILDTAVEKLPSRQKLVYHLSRVEGLKYNEIAGRLNISPLTVKKHMQQALHFIREQFSHYPVTPFIIYLLYNLLEK